MTITVQQMLSMLNLQDEMNCIVNPDWRNAGYRWARAILVETVEAIEHHGYKWWKKQEPNMNQLRMELVDIWHFMLSLAAQNTESFNLQHMEELASSMVLQVEDAQKYPSNTTFNNHSYPYNQSLLDDLQLMAGIAASGGLSIRVFSQVLDKSGMSWQDLYVAYIGKNCLNRFRQTHGYKTGEYIKDWSHVPLNKPLESARPLEDNDHLHDLMHMVDATTPDLFGSLLIGLHDRYAKVKLAIQ